MIEVEVKLPIENKQILEAALEKMGFKKTSQVCEEDLYFDNASGQIRRGGEALRIRKVTDLQTGKSQSVMTYKGKKLDTVSMSRRELETGVADAQTCMGIFEALGFEMVPPMVKKIRQEYTLGNMNVCVDQVEDLGDFLELEMVIEEKDNKEEALLQIEKMLENLGYHMEDTTRSSYLSMLQVKHAEFVSPAENWNYRTKLLK